MMKKYRDYIIRSWQPEDRLMAAAVISESLAEYGLSWEPNGADRDVLEVEVYYLDRGGEFWVVEHEGKIVGTSAYYPCDRTSVALAGRGKKAVEIRKMYLASIARGHGLGQYLLGELEREIIKRNYQEIWIETASILQIAVRLYEQNGYQPTTGVETSRCDRIYFKSIVSPTSI
jgi:putative acetyltransferase